MSKKVTGGATQPPQMQKRRVKTMPPGFTLRRSRRLTGIEVEQQHHRLLVARSRSKKLLMDTHGMDISSAALQKYAELSSNPPSATQIRALAALFGWSPPEGLEEQGAALFT
jgi:hypothetical protein